MKISSVCADKILQPKIALSKNNIVFTSKENTFLPKSKTEKPKNTFKKIAPYILATTITIGAGVAGYILASKRMEKLANNEKLKFESFRKNIEKALKSLKEKMRNSDDKTWLAFFALAGISGYEAGKMSDRTKDTAIDEMLNGRTRLQSATYGSEQKMSEISRDHSVLMSRGLQSSTVAQKYGAEFYGLSLLTENNVLNRNSARYKAAIKFIQDIGYEKLTSTKPLPPINKKPEDISLWSITSEFAPIKEGGLGSVPVEVRNNMVKLGLKVPTFVPMYLHEGVSTFSQEDGNYIYNYKNKKFYLEKLATLKIDVYKNGKLQTVPVEFYLQENEISDNEKRQLILMKCDEYFDGTIYEANSKTEEQEKFAVMSKAVYEFMKLKMDGPHSLKDVEISSSDALNKIQAPDGLILNDWQASPLAALVRYKSGMENAHVKLCDETTKAMQNMRIITLGHNVAHQGKTEDNNDSQQRLAATSGILNTLFDKYAFDIVSNAKLHTKKVDPNDPGLSNLDNVLLMNYYDQNSNHTNFLNMGIVLSDYFNPVSKNYAQELISPEHRELSHALQWALVQKNKAGKLVGVINGNDYDNISLTAKRGQIASQTGVTFKPISKTDSLDDILENRYFNKKEFYNKFILPFSESASSSADDITKVKKISERSEFCQGTQGTTLPVLSDEEVKRTPFLFSGGRLVSQKGIGILCDAVKILFDNWDKDFPNCPKPIFYIAGADGENGAQRKKIEDLKSYGLSKEDNNRILFAHGYAPLTAYMAASDFFLMPSLFEPCGLTQSESMAVGTPVVASAVGGLVDTLNRNGKENGILTDITKPLDANEFYKALKKALEVYYFDKARYDNMVKDSVAENFSWLQKGKLGSIFEYTDIFGISRESLPDVA